MKLSFRDHVIPWLKNDILPEVRVKDVALRSGVEQYIDYLEGKFRLGKIDETMNEALEKKLNKAIGLTAVSLRNFTILDEKIQQLDAARNQLVLMKQDISDQYFSTIWVERLKKDFPDLGDKVKGACEGAWAKIEIEDLRYQDISFSIGAVREAESIYYGISQCQTTVKNEVLETALDAANLLEDFTRNKFWYGWKWSSFQTVYDDLSKLIMRTCEGLNIDYRQINSVFHTQPSKD